MLLCSPCPLFHHLNEPAIEKSLFTLQAHAYKLRNCHNVPWILNNYLSPAQNRFVPSECIVGKTELNINRSRHPAGLRSRFVSDGRKEGKKAKSIDVNFSKVSICTKFVFLRNENSTEASEIF